MNLTSIIDQIGGFETFPVNITPIHPLTSSSVSSSHSTNPAIPSVLSSQRTLSPEPNTMLRATSSTTGLPSKKGKSAGLSGKPSQEESNSVQPSIMNTWRSLCDAIGLRDFCFDFEKLTMMFKYVASSKVRKIDNLRIFGNPGAEFARNLAILLTLPGFLGSTNAAADKLRTYALVFFFFSNSRSQWPVDFFCCEAHGLFF